MTYANQGEHSVLMVCALTWIMKLCVNPTGTALCPG